MEFVTRWVLPRQVARLEHELARVLPRVPPPSQQGLAASVRPPLEPQRLDALHAFADLAEMEGWLDPGEAITIRKLAYRVAFYLRRAQQENP